MRKILGLSLALASVSHLFASTLIDDGMVAKASAFPSVIKIKTYLLNKSVETGYSYCTGTLLTPNVVLTAAHCVNKDETKIQRVSLVGDSEGKTHKEAGGIKVTKAYFNSAYTTYKAEMDRYAKYLATEEYQRLSLADKEAVIKKLDAVTESMSSFDIAFLILEKDQKTTNVTLPELGCRNYMPLSSTVMLAGYGLKKVEGIEGDQNLLGVLNYGYNTIDTTRTTFSVYRLAKKAGAQLVNSGDSGGPLFIKGSQKVVFGVTSTKHTANNVNLRSTYGSLVSPSAKTIYKRLLNTGAPEKLKAMLRSCL